MLAPKTAHFSIGQIIQHRLLHFRGVIIDIDFYFLSCIDRQAHTANSRLKENQLWYHILIDNTAFRVYVPEDELIRCKITTAINHPAIEYYFSNLNNGIYRSRVIQN